MLISTLFTTMLIVNRLEDNDDKLFHFKVLQKLSLSMSMSIRLKNNDDDNGKIINSLGFDC
ncbi:hypothetical protein DERP_002280 [Dermatophagoides pteronyssinus]|uniref:Uncharacterized protein n=1 Tax=Dermatophagoides pteronyssinus TaxID=6956 RepID=A0ABQ8JHX7_DERPT|nr:hypothetical protein DERP_002280 [Dermatophagoides pteronyssinus]